MIKAGKKLELELKQQFKSHGQAQSIHEPPRGRSRYRMNANDASSLCRVGVVIDCRPKRSESRCCHFQDLLAG
jgi:hypothetical protein